MIANPLNTVFRIERDFSDLLQPIFLALFTWSLLAISGAMLIFQSIFSSQNSDSFMKKFFDFRCITEMLFLYC